MTTDQISGSSDRALLVLVTWFLTYASQKGWITTSDVATLAPAIVAIAGFGWGWWVNRPKAIAMSAASIPGTTVVTTPDLAAATPDHSNIVSNTETKVVPK